MPSGYKKSPDYGSQPQNWRNSLGAFVVFPIVGLVYYVVGDF